MNTYEFYCSNLIFISNSFGKLLGKISQIIAKTITNKNQITAVKLICIHAA